MVDMSTLLGTIRRFGLVGPAYEIIGVGEPLPDGEPQMRIQVLESGDTLDYPATAVLSDPAED